MKNIVSFETARALKEAGFPQPGPEWGQFWCNQHGETRSLTISMLEKFQSDGYDLMTFAPTATDILIYLPGKMLVPEKETDSVPAKNFGIFYMDDRARDDWETKHWHTNPAESCAAAWLDLNQNQHT